jgi:hypothetical protein
MTTKGALIAAMAASFFGASTPLIVSAADSDKVQCQGINACKGKGWIQTTEKDCKAKGGKIAK